MRGMGLQHLSEMEQATQFQSCRREFRDTGQHIYGLARRQMVANRANTTQSLYHNRYFPVGSSLYELLEPPEFDHMKACLPNVVIFIDQQGHLSMTLHPAQWFQDHPFLVFPLFSCLK